MMTIFEPLFLLLVLASVVTLGRAAVVAVREGPARALRILRRLAIGAGAYMAIVVVVAFVTPQKAYRIGDQQCFDDWCIAVLDARPAHGNAGTNWTLTLRISSRAKRVAQRENGAAVYLTDALHRRFDPAPDAAAVPLDSQLQPGESVDVSRQFTLPPDAAQVGLVFTHNSGFPIGSLIIGENAWFHPLAIVRID